MLHLFEITGTYCFLELLFTGKTGFCWGEAHILVLVSLAKSKRDRVGKTCFLLLAPRAVMKSPVMPAYCALEN